MTNKIIIIPREEEIITYEDIPDYNYDFSHIRELRNLSNLMFSPIEELCLGITKEKENKHYLLGLVQLVDVEDKNAIQINQSNLDLLRNKISQSEFPREFNDIIKNDLGLKKLSGLDNQTTKYWIKWSKRDQISKSLINRLLEKGVDKNKIIYSQRKSTDLLKLEVEVSEKNKQPLTYFLPSIKNDGYSPILIHTHPIISPNISSELKDTIRQSYKGKQENYAAYEAKTIDKLTNDLRKTPSKEDLEMFQQIGKYGIGLLITKENKNDQTFEKKNLHAFEVNSTIKKISVDFSNQNDKIILLQYLEQYKQDMKKYE